MCNAGEQNSEAGARLGQHEERTRWAHADGEELRGAVRRAFGSFAHKRRAPAIAFRSVSALLLCRSLLFL